MAQTFLFSNAHKLKCDFLSNVRLRNALLSNLRVIRVGVFLTLNLLQLYAMAICYDSCHLLLHKVLQRRDCKEKGLWHFPSSGDFNTWWYTSCLHGLTVAAKWVEEGKKSCIKNKCKSKNAHCILHEGELK